MGLKELIKYQSIAILNKRIYTMSKGYVSIIPNIAKIIFAEIFIFFPITNNIGI